MIIGQKRWKIVEIVALTSGGRVPQIEERPCEEDETQCRDGKMGSGYAQCWPTNDDPQYGRDEHCHHDTNPIGLVEVISQPCQHIPSHTEKCGIAQRGLRCIPREDILCQSSKNEDADQRNAMEFEACTGTKKLIVDRGQQRKQDKSTEHHQPTTSYTEIATQRSRRRAALCWME